MRFHDWDKSAAPSSAATTPAAIVECPFCQSRNIAATGDTGSSSTYWRCHGCGEIWNPTRPAQPSRHRSWQQPYRR